MNEVDRLVVRKNTPNILEAMLMFVKCFAEAAVCGCSSK